MTRGLLTRRAAIRTGLATGVLAALPSTALAHRQKRAQTTIEWNARTSSLEITHALHRHDAEKALAISGKISKPDLSSLKSRALLAIHLGEQFGLSDTEEREIELDIIGAENNGAHIYAYFEAQLKNPPTGLIIANTILHDVYADQINHVNIDIGSTVKTAVFTRGDKPKKVLA